MQTPCTLHPAVQAVQTAFPVRKTVQQKAAFRQEVLGLLRGAGWCAENAACGRFVKSNNIVAGNPATAKVVFTAHYDTPARMLLPNFIAPRNLAVTLLYQVLLAVVLMLPPLALFFALLFWGVGFRLAILALWLCTLGVFWLLLAGPANPHNANDNTSGVLTLLEIALSLPEDAKGQVALVFFDNEEKGLLGSAGFLAANPGVKNTLLINFDCVGCGDTFLFLLPRALRKNSALAATLSSAFAPGQGSGKTLLVDASPFTLYPSDQMHFPKGIGVAALHRAPVVGLHFGKVHTARDTLLCEDNLLFLQTGALRLAAALAAEGAGQPGPDASAK